MRYTLGSSVFPSPGTPGEGRARVYRESLRRAGAAMIGKPSPHLFPGVPGEGEKKLCHGMSRVKLLSAKLSRFLEWETIGAPHSFRRLRLRER